MRPGIYGCCTVAVAAGDVENKYNFYGLFFGLGTLPMMWSIAFFGNYVSIGIGQKIKKRLILT